MTRRTSPKRWLAAIGFAVAYPMVFASTAFASAGDATALVPSHGHGVPDSSHRASSSVTMVLVAVGVIVTVVVLTTIARGRESRW